MRFIATVVLILGLTNFIAAQKKSQDSFPWSEDRLLVWEDFKAKPKKGHYASAMSDVTFSVQIKSEGMDLFVFIQPSFNRDGAWVKPDDKNDELLKHEQTHFDIYELNARKFRKEISEKKFTRANVQGTVNRLIEKYQNMNTKVQDKYDRETNHSIKTKEQKEWNESIAEELKEYEDYKEVELKLLIED